MNLKEYCEDNNSLCRYGDHQWSYDVDSWIRIHSKWDYSIQNDLESDLE